MQRGTVKLITVVRERNDESASCCCSIGQTSEEIEALKQAVVDCGFNVQVVNLVDSSQFESLGEALKDQVEKMLTLYGPFAFSMLALDNSLIAVGVTEPSQVAEALSEATR